MLFKYKARVIAGFYLDIGFVGHLAFGVCTDFGDECTLCLLLLTEMSHNVIAHNVTQVIHGLIGDAVIHAITLRASADNALLCQKR